MQFREKQLKEKRKKKRGAGSRECVRGIDKMKKKESKREGGGGRETDCCVIG